MRQRDWKVTVTRDRDNAAAPAPLDAARDDGPDDRALVQACLGGRRDAFDLIVERHQKRVYQLCYRFAGNHEDASDLAQDVFIRAYRALHSFKGQSAFSTWLYRVTVNVCLNRVNSRVSRQTTTEVFDRPDDRSERADALLLKGERARR
jgi:RNA polymerase sigma-70 factor (ECF subfamily)